MHGRRGSSIRDQRCSREPTGDNLWRTETGPVLTQAFQGFLGQTNVIHFGKADYLNLDSSTLAAHIRG